MQAPQIGKAPHLVDRIDDRQSRQPPRHLRRFEQPEIGQIRMLDARHPRVAPRQPLEQVEHLQRSVTLMLLDEPIERGFENLGRSNEPRRRPAIANLQWLSPPPTQC